MPFLAAIPVVGPFLAMVPTTAWKYIGILLAVASFYFYVDTKATFRERAKCEAAAQMAQKAADRQDTKAETEVRKQDVAVVAQLQEQKRNDDRELEHLRVQLAKRPLSAPCYYPDAPSGSPAGKRVQPRRSPS